MNIRVSKYQVADSGTEHRSSNADNDYEISAVPLD